MKDVFAILITIHIAGGTIGLVSGTIAACVLKGKRIHLISGKIFFYSMLVTALAALVISNLPGHYNIFLFAVGGFTLYLNCSGYRIVWLKRNAISSSNHYSVIDYAIAFLAMIFGFFLIFLSINATTDRNAINIVPLVFGSICLVFSVMDTFKLIGKKPIKDYWITSHISKMMGTMIAAYTAFLVVNIHLKQNWIVWLLPTVVGSFFISFFIRKYAPKKKKTSK